MRPLTLAVDPIREEQEYGGVRVVLVAQVTRETVVAEKLEAMVKLGQVNSRMKDFYDLVILSQIFAFEGAVLVRAIAND